jgi:hypothetical protein
VELSRRLAERQSPQHDAAASLTGIPKYPKPQRNPRRGNPKIRSSFSIRT